MSFGKRIPTGFAGVERRGAVRAKIDVAAHMLVSGGHRVGCRVVDLSATGARLAVPSSFGIPDAFDLRTPGRSYRVRVVWRRVGQAAVVFVAG